MRAAERAGLYGFFSRLFIGEVDEALARALTGELGRALLPRFNGSDEAIAATTEARREAVLAPDFAHLTIVNLVPHESFYRRDDAMIEAGAKSPVSQFFERYGFEADLAAARAVAPDHLGIELEFMSQLATREAEAVERGDDGGVYATLIEGIEREFMVRHLMAWAPVYLLAVIRNAKTELYREGAEAALDFLVADLDALAAGT